MSSQLKMIKVKWNKTKLEIDNETIHVQTLNQTLFFDPCLGPTKGIGREFGQVFKRKNKWHYVINGSFGWAISQKAAKDMVESHLCVMEMAKK